MSYDDPVSADEVVRSIAAGAREGMAQVMQLGANALRAPEDAESVAEGLVTRRGNRMCETLRAIPQMWVERYGAVPDGWWEEYGGRGIQRVVPEIRELVERAARLCNVDERLLVTRMEVEQGAFIYRWDGTTSHYGGGAAGDREKLRWLCGLDKTDTGPREGAWTGPALQLLGCAARFRWLYRGQSIPSSAGLPPLPKSVGPMAPLWQLGTGRQCVAANEATAMAFRYTPHVGGNRRLRDIGVLWFPEDYGSEEEQRVMSRETVIVLDPGHSDYTHEFPGGYREGVLVRQAALKAQQLLTAEGHRCYLTRTQAGEDPRLTSRGKLAVEKGARVFVSMHTDASDSEQARGVHAIFYARNKSEASAPDSEVCAPRGRALARAVAQEVASALGLPLRNAATGGAAPWWRCPENLTVLTAGENWRKTEAACLVEGGFGSSPEDRAVLSRADAPERYALGVCRGIYRYCGWAYPSAWATGGMAEQQPVPAPETTAPVNAWAKEIADAVAWAKLRGVSDGTRLDDPLTRAEALVMLRRLEGDVS